MTPGNNGASTPEDDDPFGYLYADGQANGAQPPSGGYGYPGSVSRVRAVGERQYGQPQQQTAQYGQYGQPGPPTVPQQGAYGQPQQNYAAPEAFPGSGGPTGRQHSAQGGGGRGGGPNTKGLLIGAVAVVAAVVIGIAVVMANGDSDTGDNNASNQVSPSASASASASPSESSTGEAAEELPTVDAKTLKLAGGAALASDVQGAESDGGIYVNNLNNQGASVTWTVNGIPSDGSYTLFAHYSAAGEDQSMTLTVNGKKFGSPMSMKNYANAADGDFAKGWTTTYSYPTLTKGTNTISISCESGDKCNVLLDQLYLKAGQVKS
ncbi:carbohydrate-binding protein [Streptomyces sp. NBC_00582]|uniref:carbohydrate-binding protein n=1 Tax=Streptomyces sp. NBC_00582 TaxID=2975783 RepID=UPI002E81C484|nr:carbohydrate-binding protein [Streptomyces sp. NBC_00582]WUB63620.1 carbohydrate-binding protein [Streptomyces sp. NBC_00582]